MVQRREMPQGPVGDAIRSEGIWDLDALCGEYGLRPNSYDGISSIRAKRRYELYSAWEFERGRPPLPYDAGWWKGWEQYVAVHPKWCDEASNAEDDRLSGIWLIENGYSRDPDRPPT
jgi:hypothetical protein